LLPTEDSVKNRLHGDLRFIAREVAIITILRAIATAVAPRAQ
jgi:hypothetical protein